MLTCRELKGDAVTEQEKAAGAGGVHWLVLAEEEFLPCDSGGRVEVLNFLRAAAAAGIRMHVIVPGLDAAVASHRAALPGAVVEGIPRRTGWRSHASLSPYVNVSRPMGPDAVERLRVVHRRDPFDAVVSATFRVAHLGLHLVEALGIPLVVRPHNLESEYFRQLARSMPFLTRLPYRLEAWKLRRAEAAVHASPRVSLFADIAAADAERRSSLTSAPVVHVPPFLPASRTPAPRRDADLSGRNVLFVGSLDNGNNVDGIRWFAATCWPLLRSRMPGVRLHVVGRRGPSALRDELLRAGASVTIDAPDVGPHLAAADVFINPVRRGAGINIKMVEAMAAGLPVVTTTTGARGLHWRSGEHLFTADDPEAFSAAVAGLLGDPPERARLATAGQRFVTTELDGVRQIERLLAALPPDRPVAGISG